MIKMHYYCVTFSIHRFDSSYGKFHFDDERIHITTSLYSQYVYGLGEHQKSFLIDTTQAHNFVFWAKGGAAKVSKPSVNSAEMTLCDATRRYTGIRVVSKLKAGNHYPHQIHTCIGTGYGHFENVHFEHRLGFLG